MEEDDRKQMQEEETHCCCCPLPSLAPLGWSRAGEPLELPLCLGQQGTARSAKEVECTCTPPLSIPEGKAE